MNNKPCWYKHDVNAKWSRGFFHQWLQSDHSHFQAAIIEAENGECHVVYAEHVSFANDPDPVKKPMRFEPRLVIFPKLNHNVLLFQVHPEVIEIFREANYICQVRWVNGEMSYTQGGLPLVTLERMFKEAECIIAHQEGRSRPLQDFIDGRE